MSGFSDMGFPQSFTPDSPMPHIHRIALIGTGLIGASLGLALRAAGFPGEITGIDTNPAELHEAERLRAVTRIAATPDDRQSALASADLIVLAVPVLAILDWLTRLAPTLQPHQLLTDVGSTKASIAEAAQRLTPQQFLPGHPMAGKESGGAALAEATLFHDRPWLYTPLHPTTPIEAEWRGWTTRIGAHTLDIDPHRHDELCAWLSHLPQFLSTALSALLQDQLETTFASNPELRTIGGRALREMTRLGASPFSMWRDVAHTNTAPVAAAILALEQRLAHLRENLQTPQLRDEFDRANIFTEPGP